MSTSKEQILSQKYNNYDYAPGIATYGIDGKTGKTGKDGNNIYFTDYDIIDSTSDLNEMLSKIMLNALPLVGLYIKTSRPYKVDDLFFDKDGHILKLINISYSSGDTNNYTKYFKIVGKLNAKQSSDFFRFITNNRLALNTTYDKGFDILSGINTGDPTTYESYIDKNAALNIVSNVINENDNIDMIRMQCIDNVDIEDGQLTLAYKTTDNAFYVDSNKPVVINGDLKVNASNNVDKEYDNFSTVLTSDDTVTYFKYLCDKLKYSIIYDDQTNQYILSIYQEDSSRDALDYLANRKETVFGKIYTGADEQILVKLSDVITGKITPSVYSDYLPAYDIMSLSPSISKSNFNIEYINVDNSSIYIDYVVNSYNKSLSVDVSLDVDLHENVNKTPTYYKEKLLNEVFGVEVSYVKEGNEYKLDDTGIIAIDELKQLKTAFIYNKNGQYKFSFNTKNIKDINEEKFIYLNIIPLMNYEGNVPVQIIFKVPKDLNGTYTLYFTIYHSNQKFSVFNIMLDNENGVQIFDNDTSTRSCIQTYLPNNVDSVKKLSLLHNTEIFIDYWSEIPNDENYDNQGEITSTYMYKLLSYNSKDYVDTEGELIINYDKYYLYSGETAIWNGQVCYIWNRYEDGKQGGTKSEDMPEIGDNDPKVHECKILTNTLDIKMPLTVNSPEYVASLNAYDADDNYHLLAADRDSKDYGQGIVPGGLPEMYQGIQILQKIRV